MLDKHLPDKLSSGRGHIYRRFSQEPNIQTVAWSPGLLAATSLLPDTQKEGSKS